MVSSGGATEPHELVIHKVAVKSAAWALLKIKNRKNPFHMRLLPQKKRSGNPREESGAAWVGLLRSSRFPGTSRTSAHAHINHFHRENSKRIYGKFSRQISQKANFRGGGGGGGGVGGG